MDKSLDTKGHICLVCGKSFCQSANLRRHIRIHTGEKPYQCKQCDKSFADRSSLTWHVLTHNSKRNFKCKRCSKEFYLESHLNRHEITHSNLRLFVCSICGKSLRRSDSLKYHLKTHGEEKIFQCPTCNRSYGTKSALKKHSKLHSNSELYSQSLPVDISERQFTYKNNKALTHTQNGLDNEVKNNNPITPEQNTGLNDIAYNIQDKKQIEDEDLELLKKVPKLIFVERSANISKYMPSTTPATYVMCHICLSFNDENQKHICI